MLNNRVIPSLLLSNNGLVKTIKFKKEIYIGDPINTIRIFNDKEVDELSLIDIHASKNKSGPNFQTIQRITDECFIPLSYGGGIRNIEDIKKIFKIGVEKVILNSSAISNPNLINEASKMFGSQSIVVSVDIKKDFFGKLNVIKPDNNKKISISVNDYILDMQDRGAGEILVNDINRDGVMQGMNLDFIKNISKELQIPLIAAGGVGDLQHIKEGIDAGASAIAVGSFFVFNGPLKAVLISYPDYNTLQNLFK